MGKFGTYVVVMSGLMLLFYFTGITEQTGTTTLLNLLLNPEGFQETPIAIKAIAVLTGILASVIVVGFAIAGNVELGVMVAFTTFLFNSLWDFLAVFNKVAAVNPVIAVLIFSPLLFLFIVTTIEWWRGVST